MFRIGIGYDIHPLNEGTPLILGGVNIPHPLGLLGHSDADVICHAIVDALFGAANLGDIGEHFPDTDDAYKNISSLELLGKAAATLEDKGWRAVNVDVSVIAEEPKLAQYRNEMIEKISGAMNSDSGTVSIKATTNEGLGTVGRGEGIAAYAVALLEKKE